jgi:hypothetical protein
VSGCWSVLTTWKPNLGAQGPGHRTAGPARRNQPNHHTYIHHAQTNPLQLSPIISYKNPWPSSSHLRKITIQSHQRDQEPTADNAPPDQSPSPPIIHASSNHLAINLHLPLRNAHNPIFHPRQSEAFDAHSRQHWNGRKPQVRMSVMSRRQYPGRGHTSGRGDFKRADCRAQQSQRNRKRALCLCYISRLTKYM